MNDSFFNFNLLAFPSNNAPSLTITGKGQLKVLIIANFPEQTKSQDYTFLENVLKAAKLTPIVDNIFLLQTEDENLNFSLAPLAKELAVEHVMVFGCNIKGMGVRALLPFYQFTSLNGVHLMQGDAIGTIRTDRAAKNNQKAGALWSALKAQFLS